MNKTYLVTGGAGFIGSHLVEALTAGGGRVPRAGRLQHRPPRQPRAPPPRPGNPRRRRGRREGRRRRRGRRGRGLSPGRPGVGAAQRRGAGRHAPRLRHRHAERPRRRPAARRPPRGLRRQQQRLRNAARRSADRGRPHRAAVALRRGQGGRRTVLPGLRRLLRPGDGAAPLLQHLRPAAARRQPVFRRDRPVRGRPGRGPHADDLRRRLADARLHLRRRRGAGA